MSDNMRIQYTRTNSSGYRGWCAGRRIAGVVLGLLAATAAQAREPFAASKAAIELDRQIDWRGAAARSAGRRALQDARLVARESFVDMYGSDRLPGLSPLGSLFEWLANRAAYADTPLIRIRDRGLLVHFTDEMPEAARQRILRDGLMTPRELADPAVQKRMAELEPRFEMGRAIGRVRSAAAVAQFVDELVRIVPHPGAHGGRALVHAGGTAFQCGVGAAAPRAA